MYCGKGIIGQRFCKNRKAGSECTAPFVCDYADDEDGNNIVDLDRKRNWRTQNAERRT